MSVQAEAGQAAAAARALAHGRLMIVPEGEGEADPVEVPEQAARILAEVLDHAGHGEAVRVVAENEEITTGQAAELLRVSRPYVVSLVDQGEIPSRRVGNRRRLRLVDVLLYREIDQARRRDAARDLAAEAQELGLY